MNRVVERFGGRSLIGGETQLTKAKNKTQAVSNERSVLPNEARMTESTTNAINPIVGNCEKVADFAKV